MLQDWIHIQKKTSISSCWLFYLHTFWVSFTNKLDFFPENFPPFFGGTKKVFDLLTAPRGSVTFGTWAFLATGEASGNLGDARVGGEEAEQNTPTPIRGGYFLGVCTWCISFFFLTSQEDVSGGCTEFPTPFICVPDDVFLLFFKQNVRKMYQGDNHAG